MIFKKHLHIYIFLLFFCYSCIGKHPDLYFLTKSKKSYKAVVIFLKNETKNEIISRVIYRLLIAELIKSKNFQVVEEGVIRKFFIEEKIFPGEIPEYLKLKKLQLKTGADIIIGGDVLSADKKKGDVTITLILWARDINSGKLLWSTYYVKQGEDYIKIFHFGKITQLSELAEKMVQEIVKQWNNKLNNS